MATLLLAVAIVACKRDDADVDARAPRKPAKSAPNAAPEAESEPAAPAAAPAGPRYLRPDKSGALVDAFQFPSVPASVVEKQVAKVSSRRDALGVLKRFGLPALDGHTGEAWIAKASLVDALERERILVVSFRGDADAEGRRNENAWIVFLGSTSEDRVLKIGSARIDAKATAAPIHVDARELHSADVADVVATWSSCTEPAQKACHSYRAWTMQRGHPELIVDVTGDGEPTVTGSSAPYDIVVGDRVLRFDAEAFAYR